MSGSIIPPLNDDGTAYRGAVEDTPPDTLRAMGFGQTVRPWHGVGTVTDYAATVEAVCGAQQVDDPRPVTYVARPEWGPQTLAEAREDLDAAYAAHDLIVTMQHQAIADRNLARAELAQARVERDNARAELNRIIGG